ncbi:sporulation protein YabP [Anaerotignum sp.]|nr:sporulation protein YabP [Anaerotignum sp.]MBQ7758627.1 sporulation protein YabP [Anaerotignum sp.]
MAEEKKRTGRHTLNMEEREKVRIGGVLEVLSFDEEGIMMETTCGLLMLKGAGMHIGKLDLDAGDVIVDGSIDSVTYSDGTLAEKHSILGKLFR